MTYAFRPDQLREPPISSIFDLLPETGLASSAFSQECISLVWIKDNPADSKLLAEQISLAYKILRQKEFYFRAPNRLLQQLYKIVVRKAKILEDPQNQITAAILLWTERLWWVTAFGKLDVFITGETGLTNLDIKKPNVTDVKLKNKIFRTIFASNKLMAEACFVFSTKEVSQKLVGKNPNNIEEMQAVANALNRKTSKTGNNPLFVMIKINKT